MRTLANELERIREEFLSPYVDCDSIVNDFCKDMLSKRTVRMLNTYVFLHDSIRQGEYLALDFGGSNIRISLYNVGKEIILKDTKSFSLRGDGFDYTTSKYSLSDIFEMVVDMMEEIIDPNKEYLLGHTFSFATKAISKNSALFLEFSKGFELSDAIGQDINATLKKVIDKRGLNVTPVAIVNDTTAALLSGRINNKNTISASIIGTGHNMCFINLDGEIINMESGVYNSPAIPLTQYDKEFLNLIPNEREFLLEALVGGKNSALLTKIVMDHIASCGLIKPIPEITSKMMSMVLDKDLPELDELQNCAFRDVAEIIYIRVAYLVACEIMGVLKYLGVKEGTYHFVFDGSVYEKTPYLGRCLTDILKSYLPEGIKVTHSLNKNGSSVGAVIASAM